MLLTISQKEHMGHYTAPLQRSVFKPLCDLVSGCAHECTMNDHMGSDANKDKWIQTEWKSSEGSVLLFNVQPYFLNQSIIKLINR